MSVELDEPIPWTFTDSPGVLLWSWLTPHFVARITGREAETAGVDGARIVREYEWQLADLVRTHQGLPRVLVEGVAASFEQAEACLREHVGKCYDPRLGYRRFAGALAFRFALSTGDVIDVTEFVGTRCMVTALMPDGTERTVTGTFEVAHYRWRLASAEEIIEVVPEHVVRISNRSEAAERARASIHSDLYAGIGRIYREDPRPGCTGRPGFVLGTVDHAGLPRCPLHEAGVPERLLG